VVRVIQPSSTTLSVVLSEHPTPSYFADSFDSITRRRPLRKLELNRRLKSQKVTDRLSQQCHYTFPSSHPRCCRYSSRRLRFTRTCLMRKKNVGKKQLNLRCRRRTGERVFFIMKHKLHPLSPHTRKNQFLDANVS